MSKYLFQYCQKIVVFSDDFKKILLCKRKGENDYDGIYSFIGGKMEITDPSTLEGLKREKNEEVGINFKIKIFTDFSINLSYLKKDGSYMILPHFLSQYISGDINLSDEYSDYKWVDLSELNKFEPKIETVEPIVRKILLLNSLDNLNFEII